ncbi:hypothetical protein [Pelagicoccus sp. SDUM812003]|uniref:Ppx/GppA phosphatase family protein n=1 Tax=Pelagicoccus sp. SDUM812003 TaxID=3041267 RepID=UPI00280E7B37|nr:hypothetical protein [Pelagicoccus sp. SDUM812003]MDQ8203686.1 hypothetical protein [Pelagicoccus sp. SDUM812003]
MKSRSETVGIIDVGSNTIKLLVAKASPKTTAETVEFHVEETRIGEGMTGNPPIIDEDAIERGAAAIARLVSIGEESCDTLCIVATSAVRDASNKQAFVNAVESRCGHELRILSGDEEAYLIGKGVQCDPQFEDLHTYTLLDLGGGSLECIQIKDRQLLGAESLQLGSVRLASLLLKDRAAALSVSDFQRIYEYTRSAWSRSTFPPQSSPSPLAILTGGSAKHFATLLSKKQLSQGLSMEEFNAKAQSICEVDSDQRVVRFGIPASRADIFPTAVATLKTSLEYLGCKEIYFSEYNLRYGVASILLQHGALKLS